MRGTGGKELRRGANRGRELYCLEKAEKAISAGFPLRKRSDGGST